MFRNDEQSCQAMSIDSLNKRLNYYGGNAENRMIQDKVRSLDKALLYSYQGVTISLADKENPNEFTRDFRALLNPNKLNLDFDNKILSIPYKEIQLNAPRVGKMSEGLVETGVKCGDVFYYPETNTYWIIYMQFLEERGYFRAEVRLCEKAFEIDGRIYHVYWRGPIEEVIDWKIKSGDIWNNLNYSAMMYVTKNDQTDEYFKRFTKIEIDGKMWETQVVNREAGEGILKIALKETYNNTIEKESQEEQRRKEEEQKQQQAQIESPEAYIEGPQEVKPYEIVTYKVCGMPYQDNAFWKISNKKANILSVGDFDMTMEIVTGRSGEIEISYIFGEAEDDKITYLVKIKSL